MFMWVCACVCEYVCNEVCIYLIYECVHVCMYIPICMYVHMDICLSWSLHICYDACNDYTFMCVYTYLNMNMDEKFQTSCARQKDLRDLAWPCTCGLPDSSSARSHAVQFIKVKQWNVLQSTSARGLGHRRYITDMSTHVCKCSLL